MAYFELCSSRRAKELKKRYDDIKLKVKDSFAENVYQEVRDEIEGVIKWAVIARIEESLNNTAKYADDPVKMLTKLEEAKRTEICIEETDKNFILYVGNIFENKTISKWNCPICKKRGNSEITSAMIKMALEETFDYLNIEADVSKAFCVKDRLYEITCSIDEKKKSLLQDRYIKMKQKAEENFIENVYSEYSILLSGFLDSAVLNSIKEKIEAVEQAVETTLAVPKLECFTGIFTLFESETHFGISNESIYEKKECTNIIWFAKEGKKLKATKELMILLLKQALKDAHLSADLSNAFAEQDKKYEILCSLQFDC